MRGFHMEIAADAMAVAGGGLAYAGSLESKPAMTDSRGAGTRIHAARLHCG
jgi:hypothetical protein